jgi:hypothetical protein
MKANLAGKVYEFNDAYINKENQALIDKYTQINNSIYGDRVID